MKFGERDNIKFANIHQVCYRGWFILRDISLLAKLSQCVWRTIPRGTVDQELKTLNYASYTHLVRMVKIIRCRRPEALALSHYLHWMTQD